MVLLLTIAQKLHSKAANQSGWLTFRRPASHVSSWQRSNIAAQPPEYCVFIKLPWTDVLRVLSDTTPLQVSNPNAKSSFPSGKDSPQHRRQKTESYPLPPKAERWLDKRNVIQRRSLALPTDEKLLVFFVGGINGTQYLKPCITATIGPFRRPP